MTIETYTVNGVTVMREENFTGVTAVSGILYGLVGAWNEYQEFQKNFTRMKELQERINTINCGRFDCWKEGPWAHLLSQKGCITGFSPSPPNCSEIEDRIRPFVRCAIQSSAQMERQLIANYHGSRYPDHREIDAMETPLLATLTMATYRAKQREWEKDIEVKDQMMSKLYNSFRNIDRNAVEALEMIRQVQQYHGNLIGSSLSNLSGYLATAAAGASLLGGGGG